MKIYAPVNDFNGLRHNVRFVDGVGETTDPSAIQWFESHGYGVEDCENLPDQCDEVVVTDEITDEEPEMMGYAERTPNFDEMTSEEIRNWAKANGKGVLIGNTRNKEKLINILRG